MAGKRPVVSTESIDTDPISPWEIDLALHFVDQNYQVEMDPDLFRLVFDTIQRRRTPTIKLHALVRVVVREMIRESDYKALGFRAGIGKVNNNRRKVKEAADEKKRALGIPVRPPRPQRDYPFDPNAQDQRLLL